MPTARVLRPWTNAGVQESCASVTVDDKHVLMHFLFHVVCYQPFSERMLEIELLLPLKSSSLVKECRFGGSLTTLFLCVCARVCRWAELKKMCCNTIRKKMRSRVAQTD